MKKSNTTLYRARKNTVNVLIHILLAVLCTIWVLPIAWIVLISFKAKDGPYMDTLIPAEFTIDN